MLGVYVHTAQRNTERFKHPKISNSFSPSAIPATILAILRLPKGSQLGASRTLASDLPDADRVGTGG